MSEHYRLEYNVQSSAEWFTCLNFYADGGPNGLFSEQSEATFVEKFLQILQQ